MNYPCLMRRLTKTTTTFPFLAATRRSFWSQSPISKTCAPSWLIYQLTTIYCCRVVFSWARKRPSRQLTSFSCKTCRCWAKRKLSTPRTNLSRQFCMRTYTGVLTVERPSSCCRTPTQRKSSFVTYKTGTVWSMTIFSLTMRLTAFYRK